jgi:hypothetical protein
MVLSTYPLEYLAAMTPDVNPEPTYRLYAALAAEAGVRVPVRSHDPKIFTDTLVRDDGRRFAWFVSQDDAPRSVVPHLAGASLVELDGSGPVARITLGPYGVRVLEVVPSGTGTAGCGA